MTRICMIVFSHYPADPRVRREAEALVEAGLAVDVICLRGQAAARRETVDGVGVYRLPVERRRSGKVRYLWEYFAFIFLAFWLLTFLHLRKWYRCVHVHNMPDVLVFSALFPRLLGAKCILDLHDPMPEVFMTKYELPASHLAIRLLSFCEKLSIAFSSLVLTPNIAFRELFVSRGCREDKLLVVMNSPQEKVFVKDDAPTAGDGARERFTIMFHGTIVERHGLDTALEALALLREELPDLSLQVYGEGDFVDRFLQLKDELGLGPMVGYHGFVSLETIAAAIRTVDVGLIPNKRSPFTNINMPTRIFEYLRMGKPTIAPRTKGIGDYFEEDALLFFKPGDAQSLADAIRKVHGDPVEREAILARGLAVYEQHTWQAEKQRFVERVFALLKLTT